MKENRIDRLIELLNEYEEDRWKVADRIEQDLKAVHYIISKKFWFIQRLVENDKIDFGKVNKKEKSEQVDICIYWKCWNEENTDWVLMLLSIQDNPIDFLIDILK